MTERILPQFDPKEIAWLAGLLEGEGSFGFWCRNLSISLQMTDHDVVQRVARMIGHISVRKWQPEEPRKAAYAIHCHGEEARDWMMLILPFMGERRKAKIEAAIAAWDNRGVKLRYRKKPAECHPNRPHKGNGLCEACHRRARYLAKDPRRRVRADPLQRDWIFLRGIEGQPRYDFDTWRQEYEATHGTSFTKARSI